MKNTRSKIQQNRTCREQDIVWDMQYALSDLYLANFVKNGSELKILFDNGQEFSISVKESV